MATDGDFAVPKETYQLIQSGVKEGIVLTVFGFGSRITNKKQGHYQKVQHGFTAVKMGDGNCYFKVS